MGTGTSAASGTPSTAARRMGSEFPPQTMGQDEKEGLTLRRGSLETEGTWGEDERD